MNEVISLSFPQAEESGFAAFHLYVCAALLVHFSKDVLRENDFQVFTFTNSVAYLLTILLGHNAQLLLFPVLTFMAQVAVAFKTRNQRLSQSCFKHMPFLCHPMDDIIIVMGRFCHSLTRPLPPLLVRYVTTN